MSRKSQTADLIALIENLKDEIHSLNERIKTLEEESLLPNKNQKKTKISQKTQTNNERPILFGTIDGEFSEDKLAQLWENNDIDGIKMYISAYYAKIPDAHFVVKYCKTENKYEFIDDYIFKSKIIRNKDF
jgi:hypothetical protein